MLTPTGQCPAPPCVRCPQQGNAPLTSLWMMPPTSQRHVPLYLWDRVWRTKTRRGAHASFLQSERLQKNVQSPSGIISRSIWATFSEIWLWIKRLMDFLSSINKAEGKIIDGNLFGSILISALTARFRKVSSDVRSVNVISSVNRVRFHWKVLITYKLQLKLFSLKAVRLD